MNQTIVFCHKMTAILIKERYDKAKMDIPADVKSLIQANTDPSQHPKERGNILYHDLYYKVLQGKGFYVKNYPQCWSDAGRRVTSSKMKAVKKED